MTNPNKSSRPEFRNIAITDLIGYRLPLAGIVSILHRISGMLMFLLLPLLLGLFDLSLSSAQSWSDVAFWFTALPMKLLALLLFWALAHHLCAGLRHLGMEVTHSLSKQSGKVWAAGALAVSLLATAGFAAHLFLGV